MKSLGQKTFTSTLWSVASKWVLRFLGIISTVILARILTQEDFGIAAIATMIVALLEIVLSNGSVNYLIRKEKIDPIDYNTAWTIRLVLLTIISLILFLTTPILSNFFEEQRLVPVFHLLSLTLFLSGFQNIGMVIHRKNLNFKIIFLFISLKKLFGFIATVGTAFYFNNYWALIWGLFVFRISAVILSYYLSPYRPSLSLAHWQGQWDFSKWVVLSNLTNFARENTEQMVISKMLGIASMGLYSMTIHIASMPMTELAQPIMTTLYSAYSSILNDRKRLSQVFIKSIGIISILILPILAGFWLLSPQIVHIFLGDNWDTVAPLLRIVMFLIGAQIYIAIISNLLTALGKVKILAFINWILIITLIPTMIFVAQFNDLTFLVMIRTLFAAIALPVFLFTLLHALKINIVHLAFSFLRPFIAATVMILSLYLFNQLIHINSDILIIFFNIIAGASIYSLFVIFFWFMSKKGLGGEDYILDKVIKIFLKFKPTKRFAAFLQKVIQLPSSSNIISAENKHK